MKMLYGSQNFGYDLPNSDRDWFEVVIPTWDDIMKNNQKSGEYHNEDGSITKVKDIRLWVNNLIKGNFSDLQTLYSVETYDCDDLKWFIDNRYRIVKANLWGVYIHNSGNAKNSLKKNIRPKDVARVYCTYKQLIRLLDTKDFEFYVEDSRKFREWAETVDVKTLISTGNDLITGIEQLEDSFSRFKDLKNDFLIKEMQDETLRLVKKNLNLQNRH